MEKLTDSAKDYLLHQIKQELLIAISNLTYNDIKTEERYKYESFEKELIIGIVLRYQHMLTPEQIESLNDCTKRKYITL
jgi:hypothetical protein